MAGSTVSFGIDLAVTGGAAVKAAAGNVKALETSLKNVSSASKIVPVKPIKVGSAANDNALAKAAAAEKKAADKASEKARLADAKAQAKALAAVERQLQADKKAAQRAAAAELRAAEKARVSQARASAKAQAQAARDVAKATKAADKEAKKVAKEKAAAVEAQGEAFATQAALIGTAASAAATAVLALAAAMGAAVIAGASLAIQAAEAKGDTLDMLEAFMGSQQAALETYDAIQDITRDVAISQGRAQELAQSLTAAGVTNQAMLLDAIQSIGQVDSVIKGAGDKVQSIIERASTSGKFEINAKKLVGTGIQMSALYEELAARTGKGVKQVEAQLKAGKISAEVGVAALTATIDKKFGALAGKQLLDFGSQIQRFKDNVSRLFEDVDTGPFLEGLKSVLDLFDQSTESGKAMKEAVTATFNGLFSAVATVAPYVKTFFKGLIIIGLQAYIGMKPLLKALGLIGKESKSGGDGAQSLAKAMSKVGEVVGFVSNIFAKFLAHKPVLIALAVAAGLVVAPFVMMSVAVGLITAAFVALLAVGAMAVDWLLNLGAKAWEAGVALVNGLVEGIKAAGPALLNSIKNLAGEALNTFKSIFKIQSPSKVMMGMGENLSLGLAEGITQGGKAVNDNMTAVAAPLMPEKLAKTGSSESSSKAGGSFTVSGNTFQFTITGVSGAEDLAAQMPSIMADALEQAALTSGFGLTGSD